MTQMHRIRVFRQVIEPWDDIIRVILLAPNLPRTASQHI